MTHQPNSPDQGAGGWSGPAWATESQPIAQQPTQGQPGPYPSASQPQSYPSASQPQTYPSASQPQGPQSYPSASQPPTYPPTQPLQGGPGQPMMMGAQAASRGDDNPFAALFDFEFKKYATPGLIKIIYIVLLAVTVLYALLGMVSGIIMIASAQDVSSYYLDEAAAFGTFFGVLTIIGSLIGAVISILLIRTGLEFVIANIRIARNTETILDELAEIKAQGTKQNP